MQRSSAYLLGKMMNIAAKADAMPLHIPLMTLLMLALAASTVLSLHHGTPAPQSGYAMASQTPTARATPYGSGAALRNLLF